MLVLFNLYQSFTVPSALNSGSFFRNLMSVRSAASPSASTATLPVTTPPGLLHQGLHSLQRAAR